MAVPKPPKSPLDQLFTAKLRSLSKRQFDEFLTKHQLDEDEVLAATWTDKQGHAWSALSRLGYLWLTGGDRPRNEALMAYFLAKENGDGMARTTQAGEKDVLWAWLGMQRLLTPRDGTLAGLNKVLRSPQRSGLSHVGYGLEGDGGWLAEAFHLLLKTVRTLEGQAAEDIAKWPAEWMGANLLAINGLAVRRWWDSDPQYASQAWMPSDSKDLNLPEGEPFQTKAQRRPKGLEEHLSACFTRLVRLNQELRALMEAGTRLDSFTFRLKDTRLFTTLLDDTAIGALGQHVKRCLLDQDRADMANLNTLDLLLLRPTSLWASDEDMRALREVVLRHHGASLDDTRTSKLSPRLLAWAREGKLEALMTPSEAPDVAARSKMRF